MKNGPILKVTLVFGLLAATLLPGRADSGGDQGPYDAIPGRNMFELQAMPAPTPVIPPDPPKTTVKLAGIINIAGHLQAVIWSQEPGAPPKQPVTSVMTAGQRVGDIELLEIDPVTKSAIVRMDKDAVTLNLEGKPASESPVRTAVA